MKYILAKNTFSKKYILKLFKKIKKDFKINIILSSDKIRYYKGDIKDSEITFISNLHFKTDILSEYFIEHLRIRCKNINYKVSPYEYYKKNKKYVDNIYKNILKKMEVKNNELERKYFIFKNLILKKIRRNCDTFPIFVALSVYCTFKPRNVLDMSAGWGDRLISSILYSDCNYTGVDPNQKLHKCYADIIKTLKDKENKNKYTLIKSSFENVNLKETYDLMFSSPPYFITEEYSKNSNQSFKKYKSIDSWLDNFMYKSIDKIWIHLNIGGFLVLVINNTRIGLKIIHYVQKIMDYILNKKGAKFINMLKYKTEATIQPIWCFQKLPTIEKSIFNKPYIIQEIKYKNKNFNIIREDLLIGGSKQRIILDIITQKKEKNIFYRGPVNGYAQLALAYGCFVLGKKCHLILNKQYKNKLYIITKIAMIFGAVIHEIDKPLNNKDELVKINDILDKYKDSYLLPLGFHTDNVVKSYEKVLLKLKDKIKEPKRMWLVASSGTVADSLLNIFKNTFFNIVFVGHVRDDYYSNNRIKIYKAPQKFRAFPKNIPPYRTELSYDGKIWQFLIKYGLNNDYIFNVEGMC